MFDRWWMGKILEGILSTFSQKITSAVVDLRPSKLHLSHCHLLLKHFLIAYKVRKGYPKFKGKQGKCIDDRLLLATYHQRFDMDWKLVSNPYQNAFLFLDLRITSSLNHLFFYQV